MIACAREQVCGAAEQARRGVRVVRGSSDSGGAVALGDRTKIDGHVAIRSFGFIRQAAVDEGVVDLLGDRLRVGHPALDAPGPAVHAAIARIHEVVQSDELAGEAVEVRRQALPKLGQRGVAVGTVAEIAQDLIERAVLLHDVDDVLDVLAQELHDPQIVRGGLVVVVEIVLGDSLGEPLELPRLRHGGADQRRPLQLELVLIRGPGCGGRGGVAARIHEGSDRARGAGEVVGVGPGDALAIDDVHPPAIGAEGDVVWLVGGRDQAADLVGVLTVKRDHRHRIGAGVDRVECPAVGRDRDGEGRGARVSGASALAAGCVVAVRGQ